MDERLRAINNYYTDLEYKIDQKKALSKICDLAKEIKVADVNDFSERFLNAALIIEENLSIFKAACEHTDIITTIIAYLKYFGMMLKFDRNLYAEEYKKDDVIFLVILTILNICNEETTSMFLDNAIIKNSALKNSINYNYDLDHTVCEIMLLGDSDLYAVIRYLRNRKYSLSINKVWVQEPIKEKFLWLVKEYLEYFDIPINVFRLQKELFTDSIPNKMNIISIWTEDIIFAKNLAMSLNRDVLFINTCMDFYGGIVLLPYTKIVDEIKIHTMHHNLIIPKFNINNSIKYNSIKVESYAQENSVYNLFYDGKLQRPVLNWINNDSQLANATRYDINKCINSAEKGFKIWRSKSTAYRMQILSDFASVLECNGKSALAGLISKWIEFLCIYENSVSCSQNGGLEITKIRNPKGIIILKEEDETILFRRLIQILTVGNSVIVICDTNSCSLVPYCNMISVSKIPPGVINLLSSENIKELELSLCGMDYSNYAEQFFSENDIEKMYRNLTKPKQIIIPLK